MFLLSSNASTYVAFDCVIGGEEEEQRQYEGLLHDDPRGGIIDIQ